VTGWRPVIIFILNFIVGGLVSQGIVPVEHKDMLIESLSEIIGYAIILVTTTASLYHALKHPISKPVVAQNTTVVSPDKNVINSDTPPFSPIPPEQKNITDIKFVQ
jgi:hypothetical protein